MGNTGIPFRQVNIGAGGVVAAARKIESIAGDASIDTAGEVLTVVLGAPQIAVVPGPTTIVHLEGGVMQTSAYPGPSGVDVRTAADLGTADAGLIPLTTGNAYQVWGAVSVGTDQVTTAVNTALLGRNDVVSLDSLVGSNGADEAVVRHEAASGFFIRGVSITQIGSGDAIRVDAAGQVARFIAITCVGNMAIKAALFALLDSSVLVGSIVVDTASGANLALSDSTVQPVAGAALDVLVDGSLVALQINGIAIIKTPGTFGIRVATSPLQLGTPATIQNVQVLDFGGGATLVGFDQTDDNVTVENVAGVPNSQPRMTAGFGQLGVPVTITFADANPIAVSGAGITWLDRGSEKFSLVAASGLVTQTGDSPLNLSIHASIEVKRTGPSFLLGAELYQDGSPMPNGSAHRDTTAGHDTLSVVGTPSSSVDGSTFQLMIDDPAGSGSVDVYAANLSISTGG